MCCEVTSGVRVTGECAPKIVLLAVMILLLPRTFLAQGSALSSNQFPVLNHDIYGLRLGEPVQVVLDRCAKEGIAVETISPQAPSDSALRYRFAGSLDRDATIKETTVIVERNQVSLIIIVMKDGSNAHYNEVESKLEKQFGKRGPPAKGMEIAKGMEMFMTLIDSHLACVFLFQREAASQESDSMLTLIYTYNPSLGLSTRAFARLIRRDFDGAIADCTAALEFDSKSLPAYGCRGLAHYYKTDFNGAIADFTVAIKLNPDEASTYVWRGDAHNEKQDFSRAVADYTRAIELDPKNGKAYAHRSLTRLNQGDLDAVIADSTKAIELVPNEFVAYYARIKARADLGDYAGEASDCTKAIELAPKDAELYNSRAWALYKTADYDKAMADANTAISLNPKMPNAYGTRGWIKFAKHDNKGAVADCRKAIELAPNSVEASWDSGLVHYISKEYEEAVADWEKTIRVAPTAKKDLDDWIKKARENARQGKIR